MTQRLLYVFPLSPFSRRARLCLAHKGLDAVTKDARGNPEVLEEARKRSSLKTLPVFVDGDSVLGDSVAIAHYLDRAYADRPTLFPADDAARVFDVVSLVDAALNALIDTGTRFYALRESAAWESVKAEMVGRAQRALDGLGERAATLGRATIARSGWSAADMWLYTMTAWLEGLPARADTAQNIAQVLSLGWTLPASLSRWADAHRARADVKALEG